MIRYAATAIELAFMMLLLIAVGWETYHLIQWSCELCDGSVASYLRYHAYVYFDELFGNPFGWKMTI